MRNRNATFANTSRLLLPCTINHQIVVVVAGLGLRGVHVPGGDRAGAAPKLGAHGLREARRW